MSGRDQPSFSGIYPVKFATFSENTAATNVIIAAVAAKKLRILSLVVSCGGGANSINWESGTTDISGVMSFADDGGYSMAHDMGILQTAVGEAFSLTQTAATVVSGHLTYVEEDVVVPISAADLAEG